MSVYRTLRLRGLDPTKTIADAIKTYLLTGRLPALPVYRVISAILDDEAPVGIQ